MNLINEAKLFNLENQSEHVNAMYIFLDFQVNRGLFGFGAIGIGTIFSLFNYQSTNKKQRQAIVFITSCLVGIVGLALPIYLTTLQNCY
jgi:hypothetical protein